MLLFSHSLMSDSLWPHGLQHARLPCPSSTPGVCSNSRPLSGWCHPTMLSSVAPFSSCLKSFPASGSFPMSWLFPSGGQSIGTSASASVLPMNIQGWFPLGLTGLISLHTFLSPKMDLGTHLNPRLLPPGVVLPSPCGGCQRVCKASFRQSAAPGVILDPTLGFRKCLRWGKWEGGALILSSGVRWRLGSLPRSPGLKPVATCSAQDSARAGPRMGLGFG